MNVVPILVFLSRHQVTAVTRLLYWSKTSKRSEGLKYLNTSSTILYSKVERVINTPLTAPVSIALSLPWVLETKTTVNTEIAKLLKDHLQSMLRCLGETCDGGEGIAYSVTWHSC